MHQTFGIQENAVYTDRTGAYLIPIRENHIGVVQTPKGFFLLGGGHNEGESDEACILRECLEETGYHVSIQHKLCSAETYCRHPRLGWLHAIQTYYTGEIREKLQEPIEPDHVFQWIPYAKLKGNMVLEMQNWALEQCVHFQFQR